MSVSMFYKWKGELVEVQVDEADVAVLDMMKWSITNCSRHASSPKLYLRHRSWEKGLQKSVTYLHRLLAGALPSTVVDHLDGNGLNNTRKNLRVTTQADNARAERQIRRKRK